MSKFIVGLTGGIASGKSAVAREFAALGVYVADADIAARDAVAAGSEGLAEIVDAFGDSVLDASGSLDRAAMRRRIFEDADAKRTLEAIVHPRVRAALQAECATAQGPYALAVIPLLAEGGGRSTYPWLQRVLLVDAPPEIQAARLMSRDGIDAALAHRMVAAQATRAQRLAIADDVIVNTAGFTDIHAHVAALDRQYRALAAAR